MSALASALETLYQLNVGVTGTGSARHERPHKPLLLLAVLDSLDAGESRPERIPWSRTLVARFKSLFEVVKKADDDCTPQFPFYHLGSDKFWEPLRGEGVDTRKLATKPSARDADEETVWARFTGEWGALAADPSARAAMRDAIIARYFPEQRALLMPHPEAISRLANSKDIAVRRSSSFRRFVLEKYDHQCCACGLRIRIPEPEITFVDAAHLIPFSESRNDHPTNGVALCKHHHWAMDQRLLAPGPDGHWHVSRWVIPRRSRGEDDLFRLGGQPILMPAEPAYAPSIQALRWRLERLAV